MAFSPAEHRDKGERRVTGERRNGNDRRSEERRQVVMAMPGDRRLGTERREKRERRREAEEETVGEHIRNALQLITHVAESGELDDEHRRDLDAALFRLRFALDRLEQRR